MTPTVATAAGLFMALLIAVNVYRVFAGPTIFDRLLAVGLIGTNTVLLLVFIGFIYERIDMLLDLAITYAILNFVGVVALGKYLEYSRRRAAADGGAEGWEDAG